MRSSVKRTYNREYRLKAGRMQSDATRATIARAARRLFKRDGYHQTTLGAIAREAGVSEPTVYLHFSSKQGILQALVEATQTEPEQVKNEERYTRSSNVLDQLTVGFRLLRRYMESAADIERVVRDARQGASNQVADTHHEDAARRRHAHLIVSALKRERKLLAGMSRREAVDTLQFVSSLEVYELLVGQLRWSADMYERWLVMVVATLLTGQPPHPVLEEVAGRPGNAS
jgi:AcrR family transcriptional regulator